MMPILPPLLLVAITLIIISTGQTLFASILLLTSRRGDKVANRFLAAFMVCLCLSLGFFLLFDFWRLYLPHTTLLYQPLVCFLPPFVWFYLMALTCPEKRISAKDIFIHCIPGILVFVALLPFYRLDGIEKIDWLVAPHSDYVQLSGVQLWLRDIYPVIKVATVLQGIAYAIASLVLIKRHQKRVSQEFSYTQNINLVWMIYLVCTGLLIYCVVLCGMIFDSSLIRIINFYCACSLLAIFGYFGVHQEVIFKTPKQREVVDEDELTTQLMSSIPKYKNSMLNEQHLAECHQELLQYMEEHKPFINPQLSLNDLASELHLPARELSRVINQKSEKNFMEFINSYRINQAKQMLSASENIKILDVSNRVGFNSKSAFYEAFKKNTGLTPTQYKRQLETT